MAESSFDLPPIFVSWQILCKSPTGFFVQVSRSQVRNMLNLERKAIVLGFLKTSGASSQVCQQEEALAFWSGMTAHASSLPLCRVCPSFTLVSHAGGMGPNVEFETHMKTSVPSGDQSWQEIWCTFLGCLQFCSCQWLVLLLLVDLLMYFLIPLSKLPPALLIFSVPHLPTREKRQCCGYLRISVFVDIHRQDISNTSSRFPGPLWAEEREVFLFSMKNGKATTGGNYFGAQVRKLMMHLLTL